MSGFARWFMRLFGWKVVGIVPPERKFVCIVAPHTSFWDFVWGRFGFWTLGIPANFLIKKEFFVFPIKRLLLMMGGVPVNREQARNTVQYCVDLFNTRDSLALTITPEGTRKYTTKWKKGFYAIATRAQVPLYVGYLDYQKKETGILAKFEITGDFDKDFADIQDLLRGHVAKYPKNYSLSSSAGNRTRI